MCLLRISVLATISLSGVAVWLLSGVCSLRRHFLLWHGGLMLWCSLLLNGRLLNRFNRFRHWLRLYLRRRGLLCRLLDLGLLRLSLLWFLHHCEEVALFRQFLLLVKPFVDSLQVAGVGVLACLGKRIHGLLMSLGGDMLLCLLEILLILLALFPVLFGFFRLDLIPGLSIRTILFFGTGIVTAGCAAVMTACLIVISFLLLSDKTKRTDSCNRCQS